MLPACGPACTMRVPPGIVSQKESAIATGSLITLTGAPKCFAPSTEQLAHTVPGAQSWYDRQARAFAVVLPGGIHESIHIRSTKNGWPEELLSWSVDLPWTGQVRPWFSDLKTSTWRVSWRPDPPFRLLWYTAPELSVFTEVSPDES